jgi:hypothetical protein
MPPGDAQLDQSQEKSLSPEKGATEKIDVLQVSQSQDSGWVAASIESYMSMMTGRRNGWKRTERPFEGAAPVPVVPRVDGTPVPNYFDPPSGKVAPGQRWPLDQWQPRPPLDPNYRPRPAPVEPPGPGPVKPPGDPWWPTIPDGDPTKPPDPPTKPDPDRPSWRPSSGLVLESATRAGASFAAYHLYASRMPPADTAINAEALRILEPRASALAGKATGLKGAMIRPMNDVSTDMYWLWQANPRLPDNYEKWFQMDKQKLLNNTESHALREWSQFRVSNRYLDTMEKSVATLYDAKDLRCLPVAGPAGPVAGRQALNIPGWAPLHHGDLRAASIEFENSRLAYNTEIGGLLQARNGVLQAERRAAMSTLGGAFAANAVMDYALFPDSTPSLRTFIGDIAAPLAVMSTRRLNWGGRFAAIVGSHFVLKLWDRAEENEAREK